MMMMPVCRAWIPIDAARHSYLSDVRLFYLSLVTLLCISCEIPNRFEEVSKCPSNAAAASDKHHLLIKKSRLFG